MPPASTRHKAYPRNPQNREWSRRNRRHRQTLIQVIKPKGHPMTCKADETAIDDIVASCDGNMRGALKALLLVNEQLEAELQQLYASAGHGGFSERGSNSLH